MRFRWCHLKVPKIHLIRLDWWKTGVVGLLILTKSRLNHSVPYSHLFWGFGEALNFLSPQLLCVWSQCCCVGCRHADQQARTSPEHSAGWTAEQNNALLCTKAPVRKPFVSAVWESFQTQDKRCRPKHFAKKVSLWDKRTFRCLCNCCSKVKFCSIKIREMTIKVME